MTKPYAGRHRGTRLGSRRLNPAYEGHPVISRTMISHAVRRPLLTTVAAVGVVAATAAGYATASPGLQATAFQAKATAAEQGPSVQSIHEAEYSDKIQSRRMHAQEVAAAKARQAAAAKAAAEAKARQAAAAARKAAAAARKAAAERAARAKSRESLMAMARSNPRAIGRLLAAETHGWGGSQFSCLDSLWTKESGWKHTADNPSSSAYGIPQALPGSKMASAGSDWATNPSTQIKWGLTYIQSRYGTPCAAWAHSRANNWY